MFVQFALMINKWDLIMYIASRITESHYRILLLHTAHEHCNSRCTSCDMRSVEQVTRTKILYV